MGENYREKLRAAIKRDGQWLIDNADEIISNIDLTQGIEIKLDYTNPHEYVPMIIVTANYLNPAAIKEMHR